LPATGEPATPLNLPGASGIGAPWFGARSPVSGLLTSWQVPQNAELRWNTDCAQAWPAVALLYGP
jgi:hypothetical protein